MGLREIQKAKRRDNILQAAIEVFLEAGFAGARIEDIAARAEVSVVTLYNYFSGKGELFLTVATEENRRLKTFIDQEVDVSAGTAQSVFEQIVDMYFSSEYLILNKSLWRTVLSEALRAPESRAAIELFEVDRLLAAQIIGIVRQLIKKGLLAATVDPDLMGMVIFNCIEAQITKFIRSERTDMGRDRALTQAMINEILRSVR